MIGSVREFTEYFEGVRRRTVGFFRMIPPDMIDWAPRAGEYTCGDIVRHLAASESMFTGVVAEGVWRYDGHHRALAPSLEAALGLLDARHAAAFRALAKTDDAALAEPRPSLEPGARPIRGWRVLMAMCEHEVHHRSQLASYLTLIGVDAPDIFGLGVEDVARLADGAAPVSLGPPTAEVDATLRYRSGAAPVSLRPPTA
jgi:uncharacterized damage-inducible protein DinB